MRIDVYHHDADDDRIARLELAMESGFARVHHHLDQLKETIMTDFTDLQANVAAEDTVIDSGIVLIQGIKAKLDAAIAANDPAALQALSADIGAKTQALAAAIAANTPTA